MRKVLALMVAPVLLVSFFLAGCGGSVDETRPISEVRAEAEGMNASQLGNIVARYESAIQARQKEIEQFSDRLQEIPVAQMLGDEARAIKDDIARISDSVRALTERMNVYAQELRKQQG